MGEPALWIFHDTPAYSEAMTYAWLNPANQYPLYGIPVAADGKQVHTIESSDGTWKIEVVLQFVW